MIPDDWMPHRRADGEVIGFVRLAPEATFQPMDLLGRPIAEPGEWAEVEGRLEDETISWLDGPWSLTLDDGRVVRTRIQEVSRAAVTLADDRAGAVDGPPPARYSVPLPLADGVLEPAEPLREIPPTP